MFFGLNIGSGTVRGRRYQPQSVACSVKAREFANRLRAEVRFRMILKRHFFKSTFGPEMHLML
jgi:hypothetical protein